MEMNVGLLYRSFQRALLLNIPESVKVISFEQINSKKIEMWVVSNRELDEEGRDHLFSAAVEVEGDFHDDTVCDVHFFVSSEVFSHVPKLKNVVFAMADPGT